VSVGKRHLFLLLFVIVSLVMVSPVRVDAATDEYIATAFTDVTVRWNDEANAYDGDWGTACYYNVGKFSLADAFPSAYASGFDSSAAGSGSITQVDIVVRHTITGLDSSDQWAISLDVGAAQGTDLQALTTANYALNNQTFTDVTEPNGGGWSWAEIRSAQIHFEEDKVGGGDKADWSIYELSFIITTVGGIDYTAYPDGDLTLAGTTALAASFSKLLIEGFALAGITALSVAFVVTLIQGFTLIGTAALAGVYSKTLIEGFALAGTTSVFVIIQILIIEGFALTGAVSLAAAFVVTLVQGFALGGTVALAVAFAVTLAEGFSLGGSVALAVAYVKSLVESFSLGGTISAFKVFIVTLIEGFSLVGIVEITKIAGTILIGSIFYQLFISLNMWGYLGPIAVVIGGYVAMKKDTGLGVIWFVVECVIMAQYFALVGATPDYWWHIFIIMFGSLFTIAIPLWSDKR